MLKAPDDVFEVILRSWPSGPAFGPTVTKRVVELLEDWPGFDEGPSKPSVVSVLGNRPRCFVIDPEGLLNDRRWLYDFVSPTSVVTQADMHLTVASWGTASSKNMLPAGLSIDRFGYLHHGGRSLDLHMGNAVCLFVDPASPDTLGIYVPVGRPWNVESVVLTHMDKAMGFINCDTSRLVASCD